MDPIATILAPLEKALRDAISERDEARCERGASRGGMELWKGQAEGAWEDNKKLRAECSERDELLKSREMVCAEWKRRTLGAEAELQSAGRSKLAAQAECADWKAKAESNIVRLDSELNGALLAKLETQQAIIADARKLAECVQDAEESWQIGNLAHAFLAKLDKLDTLAAPQAEPEKDAPAPSAPPVAKTKPSSDNEWAVGGFGVEPVPPVASEPVSRDLPTYRSGFRPVAEPPVAPVPEGVRVWVQVKGGIGYPEAHRGDETFVLMSNRPTWEGGGNMFKNTTLRHNPKSEHFRELHGPELAAFLQTHPLSGGDKATPSEPQAWHYVECDTKDSNGSAMKTADGIRWLKLVRGEK